MSFAISGNSSGIATQEEAYACGLLNQYTTTANNNKKLLSIGYVQSNSNNVNGPSYYNTNSYDIIITKVGVGAHCSIGNFADFYASPNTEVTITCNNDYSDYTIIELYVSNTLLGISSKLIHTFDGDSFSLALNEVAIALSDFASFCNQKITNIDTYLHSDSELHLNIYGGGNDTITVKTLQKSRLVTGKSFQSYNITRPWHWRISEDYFWGSVGANTITAQYRYGATSAPNSMTIKEFLTRGSAYFGGSISDGKTIQVNMPVNRFYILGKTGTLESLPKYDKLTFWCGSTKSNSEWYGYYAQRNSAGELLPDWKNKVTLATTGTATVHGNDSQDAPFYSWNFLQSINNAYGVHILVI